MSEVDRDCRICRAIPDAASIDDPAGLPPECKELEHVRYPLCKCPLCGTYYDYFYDRDSGGGVGPGSTEETYCRLSVDGAIAKIRKVLHDLPFEPQLTLETDLEQLLREHPDPEQTVDAAIRCIEEVLAEAGPGHDAAKLAAWSLGRQSAVEAIPTLARALVRGPIRAHAARALATIGVAAWPALRAAVDAGDEAPFAATYALGHLARLQPALVAEIRGTLLARAAAVSPHTHGHERNSKELAAIVWSLGMCGYDEAAVALLVEMFGRTYGWERRAAIDALARHMGRLAVQALIPVLSSTDVRVVEAVLIALTDMGPRARDALPALDTCPKHRTIDWRVERARAAITEPCRICQELPERADYKPWGSRKLQSLAGGDEDLLKCPTCGTYYEYSYAHYPGAPEYTVDPHTDEWLHRRTEAEAIEWIRTALRDRPGEVNSSLAGELLRLG